MYFTFLVTVYGNNIHRFISHTTISWIQVVTPYYINFISLQMGTQYYIKNSKLDPGSDHKKTEIRIYYYVSMFDTINEYN